MNRLVLILLICVVVESTIISYPLTLLSVLLLSTFRKDTPTTLVFTIGIILDLFLLRPMGVDSLYFLSLLYLGKRYRKKIYEGAFIYRFVFILASFIIYSLLFYKTISIVPLLVTIVIVSVLLLWLDRIFSIKDKQRLAV